MNNIYRLKMKEVRPNTSTLPISEFYVKHEVPESIRTARKIEKLIEKYSIDLLNYNTKDEEENRDEYILLRSDFDELIKDIRETGMGMKYSYIFSWLINRAFKIGSGVRQNANVLDSKIEKNKSLLLKTLYEVNKEALMSCFS